MSCECGIELQYEEAGERVQGRAHKKARPPGLSGGRRTHGRVLERRTSVTSEFLPENEVQSDAVNVVNPFVPNDFRNADGGRHGMLAHRVNVQQLPCG